jgi:hypothetical protein
MLLFVVPIFLAIGLAIAASCGARKGELIATFVGFVVAAAIPAGILAWTDEGFSIGWFAIAYVFAIGFVSILGVPAFLLLRPLRLGHWWSVGAAGMLLGFGVATLLRSFNAPEFRELLVTGALGGLSAIVFWLIWRLGVGVDDNAERARIRILRLFCNSK